MEKIDLDEIEASLGYLEDWKKVLAELRAAREVAEAARYGAFHHDACPFLQGKECYCSNQYLSNALKKLDEARRG